MNVNLTPELERLVQEKVRSGLYNNQSEVIREALRLLAERDQMRAASLERLRSALAEGLAEADRGELLDGAAVMAEMREFLRSRRDASNNCPTPVVRSVDLGSPPTGSPGRASRR